jgi:hypothetical protein
MAVAVERPEFPQLCIRPQRVQRRRGGRARGFFETDLMSFCLSAEPYAAFSPNALGQVRFINPADAMECFDSFTNIPDTAGLSRTYEASTTVVLDLVQRRRRRRQRCRAAPTIT